VARNPRPCPRCLELEAEVERLKADVDRSSAELCALRNHYIARCEELLRGRRTVADRAALLAELPLSPTVEQKDAAVAKYGISRRQVNKLLKERGAPPRVQIKISQDVLKIL
jgi:hypothetical protein